MYTNFRKLRASHSIAVSIVVSSAVPLLAHASTDAGSGAPDAAPAGAKTDDCVRACQRYRECAPRLSESANEDCLSDCRTTPLDGRVYAECLEELSCADIKKSLSMNMGLAGECRARAVRALRPPADSPAPAAAPAEAAGRAEVRAVRASAESVMYATVEIVFTNRSPRGVEVLQYRIAWPGGAAVLDAKDFVVPASGEKKRTARAETKAGDLKALLAAPGSATVEVLKTRPQ